MLQGSRTDDALVSLAASQTIGRLELADPACQGFAVLRVGVLADLLADWSQLLWPLRP